MRSTLRHPNESRSPPRIPRCLQVEASEMQSTNVVNPLKRDSGMSQTSSIQLLRSNSLKDDVRTTWRGQTRRTEMYNGPTVQHKARAARLNVPTLVKSCSIFRRENRSFSFRRFVWTLIGEYAPMKRETTSSIDVLRPAMMMC